MQGSQYEVKTVIRERFPGCLALCLVLVFLLPSPVTAEQLRPLTVQLKWHHQFQFAGFYAAVEKGFYREAGFAVTLKEVAPNMNPVDSVLQGQADYGVANSELLLYHQNGSPVVALAVLIQHSPLILVSLDGSGIFSPQDLEGKRVMFPSGPYGANTLGVLLREGVDLTRVQQVPLSFDEDDLVSGQVDAMVGYSSDLPYRLKQKGVRYNVIEPRSYGVDFYGDTLFTLRERVEQKPDEVRLFREATLAGWRYALDHPQEIIEYLQTKYHSNKSREALQFEARVIRKLMVPNLVDIGHMNPGRWQHIGETFAALGLGSPRFSLVEFLYDPNQGMLDQRWRKMLWGSVVLVALCGLLIVMLILFNRRLTRKVRQHASQVEISNQSLLQKERALEQLNAKLEHEVALRTDALARTNEELKLEIAERKQREISLRLLSKAVEGSHSGILIIDSDFQVAYANSAFLKLAALTSSQVRGATLEQLRKYVNLPAIESIAWQGQHDVTVREEIVTGSSGESERWLQVAVSPIFDHPGQNGAEPASMPQERVGISHYVVSCEDVTPLKKNRDDMEKLAFYDQLTGLESRLLFKLRLENALARSSRDNRMTALMFIDLDLFKQINDTYGHDVGDEVLKRVAFRIRQAVRSNDTVARISGDEFTVIISDIMDHAIARRVAEDIRNSLLEPFSIGGVEHSLSASIGIAITPSDANDAETLIKHADVAMYQAKNGGRNDIQFFSHSMNEWVREKKMLEQDMREALSQQQFKLAYQPVVELATGKLIGLEVLLRWQHPTRGGISPEYFIPLAEETGLILPLGKWLALELGNAMSSMRSVGLTGIMMSINMSPKQIRDDALLRDIGQILKGKSAGDFQVLLELSEGALQDDQRSHPINLRRVSELGFKLVIDEFGEGGASLRMLNQLPVEHLKISRPFIQNCEYDAGSQRAIGATLAIAAAMEVGVVAVGVESAAQARFLLERGCTFAQGHLFAPACELAEVLTRFSSDNILALRIS